MKNFIITSCIREPNKEFKAELLFRLVQSIKTKIPESFIICTEANELETRCQKYIDISIIDRYNPDDHVFVNGEIANMKMAMNLLESLGKEWFYKMSYDFIIDDTNIHIFNNWKQKTKENPEIYFVGSKWRNIPNASYPSNTVGAWTWYAKTDVCQKIFPSSKLDKIIEYSMYDQLNKHNLLKNCFLYEYSDQMFDGTGDRCFDIINGGGKEIKDNKSFERFK